MKAILKNKGSPILVRKENYNRPTTENYVRITRNIQEIKVLNYNQKSISESPIALQNTIQQIPYNINNNRLQNQNVFTQQNFARTIHSNHSQKLLPIKENQKLKSRLNEHLYAPNSVSPLRRLQAQKYNKINHAEEYNQNFKIINEFLNIKSIPISPFRSNTQKINEQNNFLLAGKQIRKVQVETPKITEKDNSQKKQQTSPIQEYYFKYYIGGGNNSKLVKKVIQKREWWKETTSFDTTFNFKWQQTIQGYKYDRLVLTNKQVLNHFENHKEISTKSRLFKNLQTYCENKKQYIFDLLPVTFTFDIDDDPFDDDLKEFFKFYQICLEQSQQYHNKQQQPLTENKQKQKEPIIFQKNKHSPKHLQFEFRKKLKIQHTNNSLKEKNSLYTKPIIKSTYIKGQNIWLLKPTGLNRGRGIEIFNNLEQLKNYITEYYEGYVLKSLKKENEKPTTSSPEDKISDNLTPTQNVFKTHTFVIQKYIESPLLIHERKFDIRVWVLVSHELNVYFFSEGYLRLSSEKYVLEDHSIENKFIHLTNNAVQKYSDNYCKYENGNQLSFEQFDEYLKQNHNKTIFHDEILPKMKKLCYMALDSARKKLMPEDRKYCFEIFGYDFFVDSDYQLYLIEVNTNPCIEESSPLLEMLLPRMLDDAFKLTLDVIFPKPKRFMEYLENSKELSQSYRTSQKALNIIQGDLSQAIQNSEQIKIKQNESEQQIFSVKGYQDSMNMWYLSNMANWLKKISTK